ncbi:MAG: hypothetical protein C4617_04445 [Candidatus Liberibacter europaeus]|uniref:Uncharacterized protein n=1 Tax=Candidatus Liberibacter europaeus TaxID=744859 RepID=A0A2T4VWW1_9HYPH|nr:hypothetical protein [Candidatus Liberibacter europaeus]PTL86261.1 MAG: hypothetical protein C4617_04445 [Candidatus Liberibacter europaeus]
MQAFIPEDFLIIANKALQKLGVSRIESFDEGSEEAENCKLALPFVLGYLFRSYDWRFANTSTKLARFNDKKNGKYVFPLPADCVYLRTNNQDSPWTLEGNYLLSDDNSPIEISYTKLVLNPDEWDAIFRECIVLKLAIEICDKLVESDAKKNLLLGEFERTITLAKARSGGEGPPIVLSKNVRQHR